jgi:Transcriptional regulatory protein, C terminal
MDYTNVWLVESPLSSKSLLHIIAANYSTRLFASVESMEAMTRIGSQPSPTALVVSCSGLDNSQLVTADEKIELLFSTTFRIFVTHQTGMLSEAFASSLAGQRMRAVVDLSDPEELINLIWQRNRFQSSVSGPLLPQLIYRDVSLDVQADRLKLLTRDSFCDLTTKESKLLGLLIRRQNIRISREEILHHVWDDLKVADGTINSHISRLRRHLEGSEVRIESVYGGGYILR